MLSAEESRKIRELSGKTQLDIAQGLGWPRERIVRFENGKAALTPEEAATLEAVLLIALKRRRAELEDVLVR